MYFYASYAAMVLVAFVIMITTALCLALCLKLQSGQVRLRDLLRKPGKEKKGAALRTASSITQSVAQK